MSSHEEEQFTCDPTAGLLIRLPEITEHVFHFLPMQQLHKCARVCKLWNRLASREKQRRVWVEWFLHQITSDITESIGKQIKESFIEPRQVVVFGASETQPAQLMLPDGSSSKPRGVKMKRVTIDAYLKERLPHNCQVSVIYTDGIVGTSGNGIPKELEAYPLALSGLLLPSIPGVEVVPFWELQPIDDEESEEGSHDGVELIIDKITETVKHKKPKLIIIFNVDLNDVFMGPNMSKTLLQQFDGRVLVAGGYVDMVYPPVADLYVDPLMSGLAFCGDQVRAASVVIPQKVRKKEGVIKLIEKLRATHIPDKNSFAFMFACLGRGKHMYKEENVESLAFKKVFPRTPLFGFFGNGEIGCDFLPNFNYQDQLNAHGVTEEIQFDGRTIVNYPKMNHAYSTVFVMVSVG